jgi:hypothetical protein
VGDTEFGKLLGGSVAQDKVTLERRRKDEMVSFSALGLSR